MPTLARVTLIWAIALLSHTLYGQKAALEGRLTDKENAPLELANLVVLALPDSTMATYGFSDNEGRFRLEVPADKQLLLKATFLGMEALDTLVKSPAPGESLSLRLRMRAASEQLQTAEVTENMPITISGDTISYKADAFTSGEEKKLKDVLRKLPGFEVSDEGQIKVEGKTVSKVQVEGKDFFEGDSKIAADNIPAESVDKVQVLRNYEEIAPLKGLSSEDRVALNVKLKEGKKNMWFGDVEAQGGTPERYRVHLNSFFYTPKASFNFIGDINNIGRPAFTMRDYFRFSGGFSSLANRSGSSFQLGADNLGLPLGEDNRAVENTSRFGAANFSYNPHKHLNFSGYFIANQSNVITANEQERTYVRGAADSLPDQEVLASRDQQINELGLAKVGARYTPSKNLHLAYDFFGKLARQRSSSQQSSTFLSDAGITSRNTEEPEQLRHNLSFFYDAGRSVMAVEAQYFYKRQNPLYRLRSSLLPLQIYPLLNDTAAPFRLRQRQITTSRQFTGEASYYYVLNDKNHLELSVGGSSNDQQQEATLSENPPNSDATPLAGPGFDQMADYGLNDLYLGLAYKTKWGDLTFHPKLYYHWYQLRTQQRGQGYQNDFQFFLPEALLRYDFSKSKNLRLNYRRGSQFADLSRLSRAVQLQGYNGLFQGRDSLLPALSQNLSLNYFHYDMFSFTTLFAGLNYSHSQRGLINAVRFSGLGRVYVPINAPGATETVSAFGRYSRRFKWVKVDAGLSYNLSYLSNRVNGENTTNENLSQTYNLGAETSFENGPNVELDYRLTLNDYSVAAADQRFTNHQPKLTLRYQFWEGWQASSSYTYNNYGRNGQRTSFSFWDARLEYQKPESDWRFSIEGLNLLNTQDIQENRLSQTLITNVTYQVLPRYLLLGVFYDL
jgi:hypothetical protein